MNHPFIKTKDTDYIVQLEDNNVLHLDSKILIDASNASANLNTSHVVHQNGDKVTNKDLTEYNCYDVVDFFTFLYPGKSAELTEWTNFKTILDLCREFTVDWLVQDVENFLCNKFPIQKAITTTVMTIHLSLALEFKLNLLKKHLEELLIKDFVEKGYDKSEDDDFFRIVAHFNLKTVKESFETFLLKGTRNRNYPYYNYLAIAEYYDYETLKQSLLSSKLCSTKSLEDDVRISNMSQRTIFEIVKSIIRNRCWWSKKNKVLEILDQIYAALYHHQVNEDLLKIQMIDDSNKMPLVYLNNSPSLWLNANDGREAHPFKWSKDSDVTVIINNTQLHLHSSILSHCSPVFRATLNENHVEQPTTRSLILRNKIESVVIEFFEFFYTKRNKSLSESSNIEELIALSHQYQVVWLTEKIETFVIETFDLKNIVNLASAWWMVDRYQLKKLKMKLQQHPITDFTKMTNQEKFGQLKPTTKYDMTRIVLTSLVDFNKGGAITSLQYLDKLFKYE